VAERARLLGLLAVLLAGARAPPGGLWMLAARVVLAQAWAWRAAGPPPGWPLLALAPLALAGLPLERLARAAISLGYVTAFARLTPPERLFVSLRAAGVPAALLDLAERGWRQGRQLAAAAIRMREGVLLRSAGAPPSLQMHGQMLGAAVDLAVRLALRSEESVVLRSAPRRESPAPAPAVQAVGLGLGERLRALQLEVGPGEVVVAGPSGSGKTTLLRLLAGLERADGGTLLRFGRPLVGASLAERVDARRPPASGSGRRARVVHGAARRGLAARAPGAQRRRGGPARPGRPGGAGPGHAVGASARRDQLRRA
jgi:ABC-type multidrug transport system fused ATPase/permease subunit